MGRGRGAAAFAIGIVGAVLVACVGDDPFITPGGSSDPGDGGPASSLNCPLGCLPFAPPGWSGPSAVYDGAFAETPADCPTQYTVPEVSAKRDVDAAPTTCACGAPTFAGGACTYDVTGYGSAGCSGLATMTPETTGTCFLVGALASVRVAVGTVSAAGTCTLPTIANVPAPVVGTATKACGLPQAAACSAERADCTTAPSPASPFTRLCIHKTGDEACPSADYPVKLLSFQDMKDDRGCVPCAGSVTGGTCNGQFTWSDDAACATSKGTPRAPSTTCYAKEGQRLLLAPPQNPTCEITTFSTPTGSLEPTGPVTFCCAK